MALERFDLIIVGGGAVGLAAAYHAEKRGKKTLVLEQHDFFHDHTASSGQTRQFRIQYNDRTVSQLVLDSIPLWEELQGRSRDEIQKKVGCLWFGDPLATGAEGQIQTVIGVMKDLGLPYEELSSQDIARRFDFTDVPARWNGFFQPDGASTNVKATLRALHQAAAASPRVVLLPRHRVVGIDSGRDGVRVETEGGGAFAGDKLILRARSIRWVPDPISNSGAVICDSIEHHSPDRFRKARPHEIYAFVERTVHHETGEFLRLSRDGRGSHEACLQELLSHPPEEVCGKLFRAPTARPSEPRAASTSP
jgi:hypothetical protein